MRQFDLQETICGIEPADKNIMQQANARLNALAKPPGSLGQLEELAARLCGVSRSLSPDITKRCVIVCAADNGVVAEGVSSAPQSVTAAHTINILNGSTGVGVLAKRFGAELMVADIGVNAELKHPGLIDRKLRLSTGNITKEPAMTQAEAQRAVEVGIELAHIAHERGYNLIGVGEMGIGNTTTSSAVLSVLLGLGDNEIASVVGRGAGLDDKAYENKLRVIKDALALHHPDKDNVLGVLAAVGGLDIAAMTGVFIGAAHLRMPVVIDGFISIVAALCAFRLSPVSRDYMFASHISYERGFRLAADMLGLKPVLDLDMRLGEGSGCPILFGLMDASLDILLHMATFEEARIDEEYIEKIDGVRF